MRPWFQDINFLSSLLVLRKQNNKNCDWSYDDFNMYFAKMKLILHLHFICAISDYESVTMYILRNFIIKTDAS